MKQPFLDVQYDEERVDVSQAINQSKTPVKKRKFLTRYLHICQILFNGINYYIKDSKLNFYTFVHYEILKY